MTASALSHESPSKCPAHLMMSPHTEPPQMRPRCPNTHSQSNHRFFRSSGAAQSETCGPTWQQRHTFRSQYARPDGETRSSGVGEYHREREGGREGEREREREREVEPGLEKRGRTLDGWCQIGLCSNMWKLHLTKGWETEGERQRGEEGGGGGRLV